MNFSHPTTIWKLFDAFHHKKWDSVGWTRWPKTIEIVSAKIQVILWTLKVIEMFKLRLESRSNLSGYALNKACLCFELLISE